MTQASIYGCPAGSIGLRPSAAKIPRLHSPTGGSPVPLLGHSALNKLGKVNFPRGLQPLNLSCGAPVRFAPGTPDQRSGVGSGFPSAPSGDGSRGQNPTHLQRVIRVAASITLRLLILADAPVPTPEIDFRSRSNLQYLIYVRYFLK